MIYITKITKKVKNHPNNTILLTLFLRILTPVIKYIFSNTDVENLNNEGQKTAKPSKKLNKANSETLSLYQRLITSRYLLQEPSRG